MTFEEAIALQPLPLRAWVTWMVIVMLAVPVIMLIFKGSRREGLIIAASTVVMSLVMNWFYGVVGYVRLLGLPHILIWTPLALYLWSRRGSVEMKRIPKIAMFVLLATIVVSLGFDYVDAARWLLGERAPLAGDGVY